MKQKVDTNLARISSWAVAGVALLAAVLSFHNIAAFAILIGVPSYLAPAYPLFIDGMLLASSLAVLRYARRGERSWLAVGVLAFGVGNSIFTNSYIVWGDTVAMYGHALPPLALFLTVELLVKGYKVALTDKEKELLKQERAERAAEKRGQSKKAVSEAPTSQGTSLSENKSRPVPSLLMDTQDTEADTGDTEPIEAPVKTPLTVVKPKSVDADKFNALVASLLAQEMTDTERVRRMYEEFSHPELSHSEVGQALGIPTKTVGIYRKRSMAQAS